MCERLRHVLVAGCAVLIAASGLTTVAAIVLPASPAAAASSYDIGGGDTLIMLTPTETKQLLSNLNTPAGGCNPIPGVGGSLLGFLVGKAGALVGKAVLACTAYTKLRWIMNQQVKVAMARAASDDACFPLVIDTASWGRSPKVRTAVGDKSDLDFIFEVRPNQVQNFKNRGDASHPSLPVRCTTYNPRDQAPLPDAPVNCLGTQGPSCLPPAPDYDQPLQLPSTTDNPFDSGGVTFEEPPPPPTDPSNGFPLCGGPYPPCVVT